jgi:hypothetical protein
VSFLEGIGITPVVFASSLSKLEYTVIPKIKT